MARPSIPTLDAGALSRALATFLANAPSPWRDMRPFHDWCDAQARLRLESDRDWLGSELRHLLAIERDSENAPEDHSGPNRWLRHLRIQRVVHCDGARSEWLAVLTVALLKDPARTALVDAMTRWSPATPSLESLERPRPRPPRSAA